MVCAAPVAEQAPPHEAGGAGGRVGAGNTLALLKRGLGGCQLGRQRHLLLRRQQVGVLQPIAPLFRRQAALPMMRHLPRLDEQHMPRSLLKQQELKLPCHACTPHRNALHTHQTFGRGA